VEVIGNSIGSIVNERLVTAETRLGYISQRLSDSSSVLERATLHIDAQQQKIRSRSLSHLELSKQKLGSWSLLVAAHDPQRVLERGYSLSTSNGELVTSSSQLKEGQELITRFADGEV